MPFARAAIAVKAGEKPLGTIWAIESVGGITQEGERLLLEGGRLAALHILGSQLNNKSEFQVREGTLIFALTIGYLVQMSLKAFKIPKG